MSGAKYYLFSDQEQQTYSIYFFLVYWLIAVSALLLITTSRSYKRDWRLFSLVFFCCYVLVGFTITNSIGWDSDSYSYIFQAKSIVEGNPSAYLQEFGFLNKATLLIGRIPPGPLAYPWGYPMLLAPLYALSGLDLTVLKLAGIAFFTLFSIVLLMGFKKYHKGVWLYIFVFLVMFNPFLVHWVDKILSDIPFLFVSTISVLFMGRLIIEKRTVISPICDHILLGIILASAFFIRSNGILILCTLFATQVLASILEMRRSRRPRFSRLFKVAFGRGVINLLPYLTFGIMTIFWRKWLPEGGSSHLEMLRDISGSTIFYNLKMYSVLLSGYFELGRLNNPYLGLTGGKLIFFSSLVFAFIGIVCRWKKDSHIIIYILLTYTLCVLWTFGVVIRYLMPIVPFYISFVVSGIEWLQRMTNSRIVLGVKKVTLASVIFVMICFSVRLTDFALANLHYDSEELSGPLTESSTKMFSVVKEKLPPDSVVIFFAPRIMKLFTGNKSIVIKKASNIYSADYLVSYRYSCSSSIKRCALPLKVEQISELLEVGLIDLVYESYEFNIYKVTKRAMAGKRGFAGYVDDSNDLRAAFYGRGNEILSKWQWGRQHWLEYGYREDRKITPYDTLKDGD
jgi:hypothetical protein